MKNNLFIFSLFLFLLSSCDGNEDSIQPEFVELSIKEIRFDYKEDESSIELNTSDSWEIEGVPQWVTVSKQNGTKDDKNVTLVIQRNKEHKDREVNLIFRVKDQKETLHIYQKAKPEVEYSLPRLGFSSLNSLVSGAYSETEPFDLEFEAGGLFINELNKELMFPGSLFAGNMASFPKIEGVSTTGYTYFPMIFSATRGSKLYIQKDFMPSYAAYRISEKEMIDKLQSNSSLSFSASNGTYYYSRRHLHCIGLYETGISIEELLNGKSYKEEPMKHEFGIMYPVSQILFAADINIDRLLTEELNKEEFTFLQPNYISTINYGNKSLLLVESDFEKGTVNSLMSKLNDKAQLSAEETKMAEQIDAYYLYLVSVGKFDVIKGNLIEVVQKLNDPQAAKPAVLPVSFNFAEYYTRGVGKVKYKVHVE